MDMVVDTGDTTSFGATGEEFILSEVSDFGLLLALPKGGEMLLPHLSIFSLSLPGPSPIKPRAKKGTAKKTTAKKPTPKKKR